MPRAARDDRESLRRSPNRWAWTIKHVWDADLDSCEKCDDPMPWVEVANINALRLVGEHAGLITVQKRWPRHVDPARASGHCGDENDA